MDFCNESLGTKVTASHVNFDGHEVDNLISSNARQRRKGFIAESYIKPPVDITFRFPCNVELSSVQLCTSVGCQKSVGIDLLSLISRNGSHIKAAPECDEVLLAKCHLTTEGKVQFVNPLFKPRPPFTYENPNNSQSTDVLLRNMKCTMQKPLSVSQGVKLRIWKTDNRSQPAMGRVSIYGIPSRGVNKLVVDRLLASLKPASHAVEQVTVEKNISKKDQPAVGTEPNFTKDTAPEEFIDPLTYEIMTFPVVLPSGNTIDQITLDRHISSEITWARQPSDPFTGVAFTAARQPVPNAHLKSRIDQFLLQHDDLVNGRTTGKRKHPLEQGSASPYAEMQTGTAKQMKFYRSATGESNSVDMKDHSTRSRRPVTSDPRCEGALLDSDLKATKSLSAEPMLKAQKPELSTDHETRLNQSLDVALKDTLGTLTSFSVGTVATACGSKWNTLFQSPSECVACKARSKGLPLYQLPCSHKMCRRCLTSVETPQSKKQCPSCDTHYLANNVARCHY